MKIFHTLRKSSSKVLLASFITGIIAGKFFSWLALDVAMPHFGFLTGGIDIKNISLVMANEKINDFGEVSPAIVFNVGSYIGYFITALFITFGIIMVNRLFFTYSSQARHAGKKQAARQHGKNISPRNEFITESMYDFAEAE